VSDKTHIEDEIAARHLQQDKLSGRTMYEGHVLVDLSHLVNECRALRLELERTNAIGSFERRIKAIRTDIEQRLDAQAPEAHLPRMMLSGQLQILDALLENTRLYTEK
jgi:hypothetical protein